MKVFILADGDGKRWGNYKGIEKQMITIDGETILHRMCRLCHENGILKNDLIIIGAFSDEYAINDKFDNCKLKRQLFLAIAKKYNEPFIMLNGDCYYTESIIKDCINRNIEKWGHWCRLNANPHTGKEWGEGYIHKVIDINWWITKLEEFNKLCESGEINLTNDWTINRYLAGWQDIYTHREDLPNDYDILWNDETDDFDFPVDLDRFIKVTGKRLG
jgi:hypothetical protein